MVSCCDNLVASMRHRLTIQVNAPVPDGQGGFTEFWMDAATVWGSITTLKAYQRYQAMQMQTPATHKIIVRYFSDLTTANRLKFGDRIFWVNEVINLEMRNRYLEIQVNERE